MSTRSRIGMVRDDGKVISIYNHYDGYPNGCGICLLKYYQNKEKVEKLMSLGDCSYIGKEVDIPEGVKHTFNNPVVGITVSYIRDRGEKGCVARIDESEEDFWKSDIEEWGYLYKNGKWYFATSNGTYKDGVYQKTPADKREVSILNKETLEILYNGEEEEEIED